MVVGTPIGNLSDITYRAVETLKEADLVAAEDTRRTRKLLSHLGINPPMVSYRSHNRQRQAERLLAMLKEGKRIALVTDAGMPGISDPGFILVRLAREAGFPVRSIPGVSSLTAALSISGFPADRFIFEGFLSHKKGPRKRRLQELSMEARTVIIFESPHRIASTVDMLAEICPERPMVLAREMTKIFEEIIQGTPRELAERLEKDAPRGEYTLIMEGRT